MTVENQQDLMGLMTIGRIVGMALQHMVKHVEPGITTAELDVIGATYLEQHGAKSAPITAYNFPGYTCISINDEAAHGIPSNREIQPGDLVNIDVSAHKDGYWADTGMSIPVPPISPENQHLIDSTKKALEIAINHAKAGQPINAIGKAVEGYAKKQGYRVLTELGGHGVGRKIHEPPKIPNHFVRGARQRLKEGQVVTLEPFLTKGSNRVDTLDDGWTLRSKDRSLVAQFEHTVVITKDKPILVTAV